MPATLSSAKTQAALRTSARVSWQMLLVLVMAWVVLWILGQMWSVIWPLVVALLITTLTWPVTRFLRRHGWRPALAASMVTVVSLLIAAGTVVLIAVRWPRSPVSWSKGWSTASSSCASGPPARP